MILYKHRLKPGPQTEPKNGKTIESFSFLFRFRLRILVVVSSGRSVKLTRSSRHHQDQHVLHNTIKHQIRRTIEFDHWALIVNFAFEKPKKNQKSKKLKNKTVNSYASNSHHRSDRIRRRCDPLQFFLKEEKE